MKESKSPPSRAAWIEIRRYSRSARPESSPPSRAAWIEIAHRRFPHTSRFGRRLHGRRGLKWHCCSSYPHFYPSPPSRAAWIEMSQFGRCVLQPRSRRLHGRRGLKSIIYFGGKNGHESPPSRAAWIEMALIGALPQIIQGRRLHGRRGLKCRSGDGASRLCSRRLHGRRGLKSIYLIVRLYQIRSPPSRAAWIEISAVLYRHGCCCVAAFTGGVD